MFINHASRAVALRENRARIRGSPRIMRWLEELGVGLVRTPLLTADNAELLKARRLRRRIAAQPSSCQVSQVGGGEPQSTQDKPPRKIAIFAKNA